MSITLEKQDGGSAGPINDIRFDFYGRRFASCSTDRSIKVFDFNEDTEKWDSTDISSAHDNQILRLDWAHPEFGQLIASCSDDKTVHIREEQEENPGGTQKSRWTKKATLSDSKDAVRDVKFSPRHLGLKLAAASADGYVRIYEATDVFTLHYWPLQDSFEVEQEKGGLLCLSWNDATFEPQKLVVGGYSKNAQIWVCDAGGRWVKELSLGEHDGPVHDVAWAPGMGRSYHLIASCDRTNKFRIHKIERENGTDPSRILTTEELHTESKVWRVAWNATGTVLATSSDDGALDLWRCDFDGKWQKVQSLQNGFKPTKYFYRNA